MPVSFRPSSSWILIATSLAAGACGPILANDPYPTRTVLAQEQTTNSRYYTLEQAMTEAAAESLGQASAAHQLATQAQKTATDTKQLADTLEARTKEMALTLEELQASVAELRSHPATAAPQEPLKTSLIVLMQVPDAAIGLDAKGPEVRQLNLLLIMAGYLKDTTVHDHYSKRTMAAVKALQKDQNLPTTGIFDDATARALASTLGATTVPLLVLTGAQHTPVSPNPLTRSEPSAAGPQRPGLPVTTAGPHS
jgi:murein L,D-transpeptidase YcbB/YkuD